jgi:hypothetical protein
MKDLRELIGQKVIAMIGEDEAGDEVYIKCKIIHLMIHDSHFEMKGEPISIQVNVEPLEDLPYAFDYEQCNDIYLSNILKYY